MNNSKKTLYEKIYNQYKIQILSGELASGVRLPSEMEIAQTNNVSRITVIRALKELEAGKFINKIRGKGSYVTDREWESNSQEKKNVDSPLDFISLILPFDEEFSSLFLKGIQEIAKSHNCLVTFSNTAANKDTEIEIIDDLLSKGAKGLIIYPSSETSSLHIYSKLILKNIPFVLIDHSVLGAETPLISVDNRKGGELISNHLFNLGHRRIIFVGTWVSRISSERERYKGFYDAHMNFGIPLIKDNLYTSNDALYIPETFEKDSDSEKRNADYLLNVLEAMDPEERPTAIVAVNDKIAKILMSRILDRGLKIPENYSLTGFDNLSFAAHLPVPMTTVEQPAYEIGLEAARTLFHYIKHPESPRENRTIEPRLIVRESTGEVSHP